MNIKQIEKQIIEILIQAGIEQNEAKTEAKMLIKHFCNFSNKDFIIRDSEDVSAELIQLVLDKATLRATTRRPIQHIIGTAYFMGEDFIVDEHVLIPRDETEILVRKVVEILEAKRLRCKDAKPFSVLDIGVGSGCISCMAAKLTSANVLGVDISLEALNVALGNAQKLGLVNRAVFRKSDLFSNIHSDEKFDVIVSNPPYIPPQERENLEVELKFEPESALFATDFEGIEFYDKIIKQSPDYLNPGGYLMFELGINQSGLVKSLMEEQGFENVQVEKDLAGIDRIIWGEYKC